MGTQSIAVDTCVNMIRTCTSVETVTQYNDSMDEGFHNIFEINQSLNEDQEDQSNPYSDSNLQGNLDNLINEEYDERIKIYGEVLDVWSIVHRMGIVELWHSPNMIYTRSLDNCEEEYVEKYDKETMSPAFMETTGNSLGSPSSSDVDQILILKQKVQVLRERVWQLTFRNSTIEKQSIQLTEDMWFQLRHIQQQCEVAIRMIFAWSAGEMWSVMYQMKAYFLPNSLKADDRRVPSTLTHSHQEHQPTPSLNNLNHSHETPSSNISRDIEFQQLKVQHILQESQIVQLETELKVRYHDIYQLEYNIIISLLNEEYAKRRYIEIDEKLNIEIMNRNFINFQVHHKIEESMITISEAFAKKKKKKKKKKF
eukprot:NODE_4469_length_1163_cov_85.973077_g3952_i0.p1 GENE.NODE_4469_length_1163_cov_85.973077_g3952_i0~~NODE_4469_length_1163_cov_85.973077_g3952_i0.p1  ORF type:complete len:368 (+),score=59.47 NODE_4469_length_1163_cov_85.973077_g3952_i0:53-1156(+)